jgi:hypothetical protein
MSKKPAKSTAEADLPAWHRYVGQPARSCPICRQEYTTSTTAVTCGKLECAAEYEHRYNLRYYADHSDTILANQKARVGSRATPPKEGYCEAPHPTKPGELCGKEFEATGRGKGRRRTCSPECVHRLRMAQQVERYHKDQQAKRAYKNDYYADNYAQPQGETYCQNPGCRRQYIKTKKNQTTCGRAVCQQWLYKERHPEKVKEIRRNRRRNSNDADAAYQRDYRKNNPNKFKSYRPKINARQQHRRATARQEAIANGTFVDRRRKLSASQIAKIKKRRKAGETLTKIAKVFKIHFSTVARICEH